ncbi:MAG: hypothetical protein F7B20_06545 [Aeropyrum sp.]|nr:hypothetical protein [Aeropyrum sp.]MCE4615519.1 hypothetical protein [Aeropyrum sp.]
MKYFKLAVGIGSRMLIALGVSLVIAAIAGSLWGVKLESGWEGSVAQGSGDAIVLMAMATASSGTVEITLANVREAYTITLAGDPFRIFDYLSALDITVQNRSVKPDIRAGIVYGWGVLDASIQAIRLLPTLGQVESLEPENGEARLVQSLSPGGSVAVVAIAGEGGVLEFDISFRVEGYSRTPDEALLTLGLASSLTGITAYYLGVKKSAKR